MDMYSQVADVISPIRIRILRELKEEKHPEELAMEFNMTRQGVDKHLAILYQMGLVDKKIKEMKRPMIFYFLTKEGESFLQDFENMVENLVMDLRKRQREELLALDKMLVDGEISEAEYLRKKRNLEKRFRWVMER